MMKIQTTETGDGLILQVQGRLAGVFVPELENCWRAAHESHPARKIWIDLQDVTCVDRSGRYLLQFLQAGGVGFLRAGLAVQDILDDLAGRECRS